MVTDRATLPGERPFLPVSARAEIPDHAETRRKLLHLAALVLPVAVLRWGDPFVYGILLPGAVVALGADLLRVRVAWLHRTIGVIFGPLMRTKERPPLGAAPVLNGATWMAVAAAGTFLIFPRTVGAVAFAILVLGDAAAALVGRRFGRRRLGPAGKTLEGSTAFVTAALVPVGLAAWWGTVPIEAGVAGALAAAVVEARPGRINDNLLIPLAAGLGMVLLG